MTKNTKFLIRQTDGILRAKIELTKEGSKIWRAGDPEDQKAIRETIGSAAKDVLKLDEVVVGEILNPQ